MSSVPLPLSINGFTCDKKLAELEWYPFSNEEEVWIEAYLVEPESLEESEKVPAVGVFLDKATGYKHMKLTGFMDVTHMLRNDNLNDVDRFDSVFKNEEWKNFLNSQIILEKVDNNVR